MNFGEVAERLTPDAETLFCAMVEAHLAAGSGDRSFHVSMYGGGHHMSFFGDAPFKASDSVDPAALNDLRMYGLVRRTRTYRNTTVYDISGDSLKFHRFLRQLRGTPVMHVDAAVRRLVDGKDFARRNESTARHLSEAFELLWSDRTDVVAVSELGGHLRSAIIDAVTSVTGSPVSNVEDIRAQIEAWLAERAQEREAALVATVVEAAFKLSQRLTHVRDEIGKGRPSPEWGELRRASFAVAYSCYELDQARE